MYIIPWHIVFLGGLVSFSVPIEKYLTQVSFLQLLAEDPTMRSNNALYPVGNVGNICF